MITMTHDQALAQLHAWTKTDSLLKHARAVEIVMRAAASKYGGPEADAEAWAVTGLLHDADYAGGHLYVLTIPENYSDLSEIPEPVLSAIRKVITAKLPVQLVAPGKVSLFLYDNNTFIVESFLDEPVNIQVAVGLDHPAIEDLLSGETIAGEIRTTVLRWDTAPVPEKRVMSFSLAPHSYRVFRLK